MAIAFSVLTSIALTSLFESITQIEDPFIGIVALDGIDVAAELLDEFKEQLICCRRHHFPNAPKFELDQIEIYADAPSRHAIHMPDIRLFQT